MGTKICEGQPVERSWFLLPPSSQCSLLPPPFLACFLLLPPLYFPIHCVMKGCLQRVNSAQHGSSGDTNHHQQQLQEVAKNYRMLFSKGITEIECVTTIPKIETWSTLEENEATNPGAVSLVKGSHYAGTINSSVFTENRFFSILSGGKMKFFYFQNRQLLGILSPNEMIFFLTSWVCRWHWQLHGVGASVGRNIPSVLLLLSHLVLCLGGAGGLS